MKCYKTAVAAIWLLVLAFFAPIASAQSASASATATGTLFVDIKPFTSEKELPEYVDKRLRNGGIEWGIRENQLVFTMVNKKFIDFPVDHMTRYGQNESLALPAGEYRITGIGLDISAGFSPQKILNRGAFVNENIVTFRIESGKTTTLTIVPMIKVARTFDMNFWIPSMMATVNDGTTTTQAIALNDRIGTSIAWPQYAGPLKFVAK